MIFKRKVYAKLIEWKALAAGTSAVLLEGARRIGKSTIVEEFAKKEYDDYMILDFARENQDVKNNFVENMNDLDTFFRNLFLLKGKSLKGKNCVIIFDEVQLFPQARQAIKYLVADGRYEYIETGSLISIRKNVKDILILRKSTGLRCIRWILKNIYGQSMMRLQFLRSEKLLKKESHLEMRFTGEL